MENISLIQSKAIIHHSDKNQSRRRTNERKTKNKVPTGKIQVRVYEFKKFNLAHSLMSVQLS